MSGRNNAEKIKALQQLSTSDLPRQWLAQHTAGWDDQAVKQLRSQLAVTGLGVLDVEDVTKHLAELKIEMTPDGLRAAARQGPTHQLVHWAEGLGTAEWADPDDFASRRAWRPGDFWIGRNPVDGTQLGHTDDRHALMTCSTRGGKGASIIIPNLLLWPGSIVCIDPKCENAAVTAARRGDGHESKVIGMHQQVAVLDPMNKAQCEPKYRKRFNPLDALGDTEEELIDRSAQMAEAMVMRTGSESDEFWKNEVEAVLQALILHVKTAPQFDKERNLGTVRKLIMRGDLASIELLKANAEPGEESTLPDPHTMLFSSMKRNERCGGVISGMGADLLKMATKGEKTWLGVRAELRAQTKFLDSPAMADHVSASDINLDDLKDDPRGMSLFLCLPPANMPTHKRWLRLMVNLLATSAQRSLDLPATGYPVLWCLDEFAALERLRVIEEGIAALAGYGVKLFIVLQDLGQLKSKYESNWQTFLANVGTKLFFSISDTFTREELSKDIGETEIIRNPVTQNQSTTATQGKTINASTTKGTSQTSSSSTNFSVSRAEAQGYGRSRSTGRSQADGTTSGHSHTDSFGTSRTNSTGQNQSSGSSHTKNQGWQPPRFWFRNTVQALPFLRDGETAGLSDGTNQSQGTSSGTSDGTNQGRSNTVSGGTSRTDTRSTTDTQSENTTSTNSETAGGSKSFSNTINESQTVGHTDSSSTGHTKGVSVGQSFHKRPLITTDQIEQYFSRLERGDFAYPGLALVKIDNERWMITQRSYYYEDLAFDGYWDVHPSHPDHLPPGLDRTHELFIPLPKSGRLWADGTEPVVGEWFKRVGDVVTKDEPLFDIIPGPARTGLINTRIAVKASVGGTLRSIDTPAGAVFDPDRMLCSIDYHLAELQ